MTVELQANSQFTKGTFVRLTVLRKYEENDKVYIALSDGVRHTYRVLAYDFQAEWEDATIPDTINCYVADVDHRGLPFLIQSRKDILLNRYTQEDYYPFKVISINQDEKSNSPYYTLKDYFGINHRYYLTPSEKERELNDVFSIWVEGVEAGEGNLAHLKFRSEVSEPEIAKSKATTQILGDSNGSADAEIQIDPRLSSKFGFEDQKKEFKSSLVYPAGGISPDIDKQIIIIAKTIAGFQNAEGGTLYLGVDDSGNVCGIQGDYSYLNSSTTDTNFYQLNEDGYENKIRSSVRHLLGGLANANLRIVFSEEPNNRVCEIVIAASDRPVFMQGSKLFQRAGNMTQLLKDDEITYFIEKKLVSRGSLQFSPPAVKGVSPVSEDVIAVAPQIESVSELNITSEINALEVRPLNFSVISYYLRLYANGDWLYSRSIKQVEEDSVDVPIPRNALNELLVFVYGNGKVNIVSIRDLFSPQRQGGGRRLRAQNRRYETGWHPEATLVSVFVAKKEDLLVFKSITSDNKKWVKLHRIKDLQVYGINAQGNTLVNRRLNDARIESCYRIPKEFEFHMSGLILSSNQTSSSLGYTTTDQSLQIKFSLLDKVLAAVTSHSYSF